MTLAYFFGYAEFVVMLSRSLDVEYHSHHAMQFTFGLEHPLILQYADDQQIIAQGVFVPSDTPHLIDSQGGATLNYLVHPESLLGGALHDVKPRKLEQASPMLDADWTALTCESVYAFSSQFWASFQPQAKPIDPRIQQAIQYIQTMDVVKISVQSLADYVNLSPSRFMVLFRQETGIPLRRYLLWHRLIKAFMQILDGMSFTDAAHEVGFADAAHLSRTFKQMFGITLQGVFLDKSFMRAAFC